MNWTAFPQDTWSAMYMSVTLQQTSQVPQTTPPHGEKLDSHGLRPAGSKAPRSHSLLPAGGMRRRKCKEKLMG